MFFGVVLYLCYQLCFGIFFLVAKNSKKMDFKYFIILQMAFLILYITSITLVYLIYGSEVHRSTYFIVLLAVVIHFIFLQSLLMANLSLIDRTSLPIFGAIALCLSLILAILECIFKPVFKVGGVNFFLIYLVNFLILIKLSNPTSSTSWTIYMVYYLFIASLLLIFAFILQLVLIKFTFSLFTNNPNNFSLKINLGILCCLGILCFVLYQFGFFLFGLWKGLNNN